ncbi:MAG: deoxyribodipyrimidine photo-lyase [Fibrobacterota bacterium]
MGPGRSATPGITSTDPRPVCICWLRRDLRVRDNRALFAATEYARSRNGTALVVFVFDTDILSALPDRDDRRVAFIAESVAQLNDRLCQAGAGLLVLHGSARHEIPALSTRLGGVNVFASHDFEPFGTARDESVRQKLTQSGAELATVKDHVVFEKDEILTASKTPFRVFTPYMKAWSARLEGSPESHLPVWPSEAGLDVVAPPQAWGGLRFEGVGDIGFESPAGAQPSGGEQAGAKRLGQFLGKISQYDEARDFPAVDGTSRISLDLRFGTISVREVVRAARSAVGAGAAKWLSELVWREFYQAVLWHFPSSVDHAFQERMERVVWDDPLTESVAAGLFAAWCEGRTGYPFIDAAMRELRATGWMHNRCRMVVASFLTKDLHIHWKRGERWFARWLLDIELASNVGGWQWAASTGADGQPWFRIFNPVEQGRKWDPRGTWIRTWCPELSNLDDKFVHTPWEASESVLSKAGIVLDKNWPRPIVDHATERREALERFGKTSGR